MLTIKRVVNIGPDVVRVCRVATDAGITADDFNFLNFKKTWLSNIRTCFEKAPKDEANTVHVCSSIKFKYSIGAARTHFLLTRNQFLAFLFVSSIFCTLFTVPITWQCKVVISTSFFAQFRRHPIRRSNGSSVSLEFSNNFLQLPNN